jgi:isopentenyl-diphosphate delta-isomerase
LHEAQPDRPTPSRKAEHLRINIEEDVGAKGIDPGFDAYAFRHHALPEIDLHDIDCTRSFLGRKLEAPLLISCMTGGTSEATRINRILARIAARFGLAMGLGSGRALLESPETLESFDVRDDAPEILLLANLGAVQLNKGSDAAACVRLVEMLRADALVLHLNPLQEALQPEGDTDFRGVIGRIADVCANVSFPIVVKEVGWGIGPADVRALFDAGVACVDVAGAGGTSWSEVERYRIGQPWRARVAAAFADWGIPTTKALVEARSAVPAGLLIASGGLRSGIDAAKAIALGADLAGFAGPFLRAAARGEEAAEALALEYLEELRIAMFCTGSRTLDALRHAALTKVD